jgi:co-chaperonin GroES (HSP10)
LLIERTCWKPWKESKKSTNYIPLQAKEGDLAVFMRKEAIEIEIEKEKLLIVPQSAILLLFRDDLLNF